MKSKVIVITVASDGIDTDAYLADFTRLSDVCTRAKRHFA
jgi:hypothetical protein